MYNEKHLLVHHLAVFAWEKFIDFLQTSQEARLPVKWINVNELFFSVWNLELY